MEERMPIAKANGINIYYEIHGKGEPLVLIAGYGANSISWFNQTPVLSKKYRVIIFDNRGTGRSDKPDIPYTIKMMADDTAGLLDAIGIRAAHVFGLSMGSAIAQEFAINYPEKVISLILGCASSGAAHSASADPAAMMQLLNMKDSKQKSPEEEVKLLLPIIFTQEFIDKNKDKIGEFIKRRAEHPTPPFAYGRQGQAVVGFDTYDRLPQIKAPTLIINGSEDKICPLENARRLGSRIPNSEVVILEKVAHSFNAEAPEKTNSIILDFLKRHPQKK